MILVETSVLIERPSAEVFAFIANFENNPKWQSGMLEAHFTSEPPLAIGSTYVQVATFLGRRIDSTFEVVAYAPDRMVRSTSISGTSPITFTRSVEPVEGGTMVRAVIEGDASGLFKIAEPLLKRMVQRQVNGDYANLKNVLDG